MDSENIYNIIHSYLYKNVEYFLYHMYLTMTLCTWLWPCVLYVLGIYYEKWIEHGPWNIKEAVSNALKKKLGQPAMKHMHDTINNMYRLLRRWRSRQYGEGFLKEGMSNYVSGFLEIDLTENRDQLYLPPEKSHCWIEVIHMKNMYSIDMEKKTA